MWIYLQQSKMSSKAKNQYNIYVSSHYYAKIKDFMIVYLYVFSHYYAKVKDFMIVYL